MYLPLGSLPIITGKKQATIKGWIYTHGRFAASLESWIIVGQRLSFEIIPSSLTFAAHMGPISHVALIYNGKTTTIIHAVSGCVRDGSVLISLDQMMDLPSPEFPGLRLPSRAS